MRERTGRGGRRSKGPRYARTIRFPEALHDAIEASAVEAGYAHVQDFVVDVMERAFEAGLFSSSTPGQPRLPLSA